MIMTARDIVSDTALELGLVQKPVSTVTNTLDQRISQMMALLGTVADEVLLEPPYKFLLGDGVWVTDKDGNQKRRPETDTDLILFDGRLAIDGLKYRMLQAKGLEYGEQMRDFISRMNKLAVQQNASVIDLDTDEGREI